MLHPRFILRAWLAFAVPLLSSGCVPSEHPLIDDEESVVDERLLGEWRYDDDDPRPPLLIQRKPGSETVVEAVEDDERVEILLTKIRDDRYLCVRYADEAISNMILRYEIQGDTLRFYRLDEGAIHDAINNQDLSGKAWRGFGKRARITATSAEIRAYLENNGKGCFKRDASPVLTRILQ